MGTDGVMGACCGPQAGVPPEPPSQLDYDKSGNIAIENDLLRGYLSEASTLGSDYDALERVLRTRSVDGLLAFEGFVSILRDFTFDDTDAIMFFQNLVDGEERIESTQIRSALLGIGEARFGADFSSDLWDKILNAVMHGVDFMVEMEQWVGLC